MLTAGGCAAPGTTPAADGRATLSDALSGLAAGNYTFARTGNGASQGTVHLPDGFSAEQPSGPSVLVAGDVYHLRYRIYGSQHEAYGEIFDEYAAKGTAADKADVRKAKDVMRILDGTHWVRADRKRLATAAEADDQSGMENLPTAPTAAAPDITGATALVAAATTATVDGSTVTGTLDATKVDPQLRLFANDPYYFYGPKASALPYRATLDTAGRLTGITVDIPGILEAPASAEPGQIPSDAPTASPAETLTITITAYGTTPVPTAPTGATDLDPSAYDQLKNDVD